MRRRCLVLLALALATGGCGGDGREEPPPRDAGIRLTPAVARDLDAALREKVTDSGVPGASAAVVFPDGRAWSGAAGLAVLEPERKMTSRSALPFGSVTKMATAALALRLVEQGQLALDDPIRRWYPAWHGDRAATVRDLLGHTAGVGAEPTGEYGLGLARDSFQDRELWGHGGEVLGSITELWHMPREKVTIAIAWNDALIGREGGFLDSLLGAALGTDPGAA